MALQQRVKLDLTDGTEVEVTYSAIDLRAWESKHRKSALTESMSVSMLTWLGWNAAKRQGLLNGSYDTWEKFDPVCESVEGLRDEPDPTKAAKKAGSPKAASAS